MLNYSLSHPTSVVDLTSLDVCSDPAISDCPSVDMVVGVLEATLQVTNERIRVLESQVPLKVAEMVAMIAHADRIKGRTRVARKGRR